ncbi:hypothetical protein [Chelativorans sp.]|uniref:hypothetical protein n=1 Tax=Chelativorans sp. TaxID=2203393 RepID=UPI00281239F4|nr:hypothetical protein [Chelativorans sp.]
MRSWRRGFFRAWVVVSMIYAIGCLLVAHNIYSGPYNPAVAYFYMKGADQPSSVSMFSDVHAALVELKGRGRLTEYEVDGFDGVSAFLDPELDRDSVADRMFRIVGIEQTLRDRRLSQYRTDFIRGTALFVILPPLALLAVGIAVAWVAAGFSVKR